MNRRHLLLGLPALVTTPVLALKEVDPDEARGMLVAACGAERARHDELRAMLTETLALPEDSAELAEILAATRCPGCGCSLVTAGGEF